LIDLHTHILPGIDDGVQSEDEAVEFARMAVADGVRVIVATPHCREGSYENERAAVLEHVDRLRARLVREQLALDLQPGAEVHVAPELIPRIRDGRAPTLADNGRTLLLELSLSQVPIQLERTVFDLKLGGIEVVLAHPERVRYFQEDIARYEAVVQQGAWGQITTGSVLGQFGTTAREFSEELLRRGLVHVLASDAHNVRGRPPVLSAARRRAAELVGERYAQAMVDSAPRALLEGRGPQLPPVERPAPRRGWFARWFGGGADR
jgi:protein-tyrosine phosphatase